MSASIYHWSTRSGGLLAWILPVVLCIRITQVQIPQSVVLGKAVTLECKYDPEGQDIYAVKWYKDSFEFYHFLPKSRQQKGKYNATGLDVVLERSSDSEVTVRVSSDRAAGTYKCEVSGEGPEFWTSFAERNVSVVTLPDRQPEIWGHQHVYRPGDNISVNCTSPNARPAVHINWFVNGEQVSRDNIHHWRTPSSDRLVTSTGNLRMTVRQHHFKAGIMQLMCVASLDDVYWKSVHVDLPQWGEQARGARSNGLFANGFPQKSSGMGHFAW
ncbi:Irregular chiasm C-roughest protein [Amphibalanus amphitrite]|uniref:Irregular chiasm C-roughest protein n=1 Tax=Amphibalanus amphitrite TaxID=1232801 RepID=A0A6A4WVY4_AMPAM|nr:Irregular chiasm C-roughest protein [Amphibalanus amphitrite]